MKTIAQLAPGEMATVIADVSSAKLSGFRRRNLGLFEVRFTDASRAMLAGKWFHGGYLANVFAAGMKVALYGKVEFDSYSGELTMLHPEFEILSGDDEDGEATLHVGRIVPIYEGISKLTTRMLRVFTHRVLEVARAAGRPAPGVSAPAPQDARPLDRHPADSLSAARFRPAPVQRLPLARAVPPDFRRVLLAGVRRGAEARQGPHAARHRLRNRPPRARTRQGHAALQTHRSAEARHPGNRGRHEGAAPHEPPAARRRGQRQDHRGRGGRGDRHRERLPGGGAGPHRNPGRAARLLLQADPLQAGLRDGAAHRLVHQPRKGAAQEAGGRGPGARGHRHARAARKGRRVPQAGARHHRRAAPLRRPAAPRPGAKRASIPTCW